MPIRLVSLRQLFCSRTNAALSLILIMTALGLRLWGIPSDLPVYYEKGDEGEIIRIAMSLGGDPDPHTFFNPSLYPYVLLTAFGAFFAAGKAMGSFANSTDFANYYFHHLSVFYLIARSISVLFGVASVGLTYLIGRKTYGPRAGLLASLFLAFAGIHVLFSRTAKVDATAAALLLASLLFTMEVLKARLAAPSHRRGALRRPGCLGEVHCGRRLAGPCGSPIAPREGAERVGSGEGGVYSANPRGRGLDRPRRRGRLLCGHSLRPCALREIPARVEGTLPCTFRRSATPSISAGSRSGPPCTYNASRRRTRWAGHWPRPASPGCCYAFYRSTRADAVLLIVIGCLYVPLALPTQTYSPDSFLLPIVPLLILLAARLLDDHVSIAPRLRTAWVLWAGAAAVVALTGTVGLDRAAARSTTLEAAKQWIDKNIPRDRRFWSTARPPNWLSPPRVGVG